MTIFVSNVRSPKFLLLSTALIAVTACATAPQPNSRIADAQTRLSAAYNDKETADRGQAQLGEAKTSLEAAQGAWKHGETEKSDHNLMMGQTYLDIAETRGQQAKVEKQNANAAAQARLTDKNRELDSKNQQLAGKNNQLAAQSDQLADKDRQLAAAQDQLRDYNMKVSDIGSTMVLQDVSFETGKSRLLSGGVNRMQPLINYLRLSPDTQVRVEGYTDNVGGEAYNMQLSLDRANAVKAILTAGGVSESRVSTIGSGLNKPIATNKTIAGRQSNRRVEVTLLKQP